MARKRKKTLAKESEEEDELEVGGDAASKLPAVRTDKKPRSPVWTWFKKRFEAPYEFFIHAIIGSIIFLVIAAAALGLGEIINLIDTDGTDEIVMLGLKGVKYALFGADLILFAVFIVRAVIDGVVGIWKDENPDANENRE